MSCANSRRSRNSLIVSRVGTQYILSRLFSTFIKSTFQSGSERDAVDRCRLSFDFQFGSHAALGLLDD